MLDDAAPGLFGRDRQLAASDDALRLGRGVLVTGRAGLGRTALADAIAARARRRGDAPVWVTAMPSLTAVPFGAFAALLGHDVDTTDRARTIGRIAHELRRAGGNAGTVLVIDDAHLLDDSSADAVVQAVTSRSIALVVTELEGRPLPPGLAALCRDGFLTHVAVDEFSRVELDATAELLLGGPLALATSELLWRWTLGVPAILSAIIERGQVDGSFTWSGGRWWWADDPRLLADVALDERTMVELGGPIGDGADSDRDVADRDIADGLDLVALAEPVDVGIVERLVGIDLLVELERRGLIVARSIDDRTMVSSGTPLTGLRRRETMSELRRRMTSRRLLDAAPEPQTHGDVVRMARWHVEGGVPAEPALLHAAANIARLADPALSRRIAEANRRWNGGIDALAGLVEAHVEGGDIEAAEQVLGVIRATATTTDDLGWLARAEFAVAMFGHKDAAAARSAVAATRQWGALDEYELASMDVLTYMLDGQAARVEPIADRVAGAARLDEGGAGPRAALRAGLVATVGALLAGRSATAVARAAELIPVAAAHAAVMPTMPGMLRAISGFAAGWRGDADCPTGADPTSGRWPLNSAAGAGGGSDGFRWAILAGLIAQVRGEPDTAVSYLRDAVVQQRAGKQMFHAEAVASLVVALCDAGSVNEAAAMLSQFPTRNLAVFPGLEPWAAGVLACAKGDIERGAVHLRRAAGEAAAGGSDLLEARYLVDLALRAGDDWGADRLAALASTVDAPILELMCEVAAAVLAHDANALIELADRFRALGLTARAIATANRARSYATAAGDRRAVRDASALARHARSAVPPTSSGLVLAAVPNPPVGMRDHGALSRRETEVATLAGNGLSDREIAARLVLSVRTVESHLASVYRKLAITSRIDLADLVERVA